MVDDVQPITGTPALAAARFNNFETGKAILLPAHQAWLNTNVKPVVAGSTTAWVDLIGYASHRGGSALNQKLSVDRCEAAKRAIRAYSSTVAFPIEWGKGESESTGGATDNSGYWRAIEVYAYASKPSVRPVPVPPPTGPVAIGTFQVDLVGWIPNSEVANPLSLLPGFVTALLPAGMADPFFGGDNLSLPEPRPAAMRPPHHTFRATQTLAFDIPSWGAAPVVSMNATAPGTTTCLNRPRSAGGTVTFSLTAKLLRSSASVAFSTSDDWYEVLLSGVVLDPVPAAAAAALTAKLPGLPLAVRAVVMSIVSDLATKATPSLTWDVGLRIQKGPALAPLVSAGYLPYAGAELSGSLPGASGVLAPGTHLIHGKVHFSLWPSAIIYLTYTPPAASPSLQPIFFSSGMSVPKPETAFILVPKLCKLRQVTW